MEIIRIHILRCFDKMDPETKAFITSLVGNLEDKLDKLKDDVGELKGLLNENIARKDIEIKNGVKYSHAYTIQGLEGLATLIMSTIMQSKKDSYKPRDPSKGFKDCNSLESTSRSQLVGKYIQKLIDFIFKNKNENNKVMVGYDVLISFFTARNIPIDERLQVMIGATDVFSSYKPNASDAVTKRNEADRRRSLDLLRTEYDSLADDVVISTEELSLIEDEDVPENKLSEEQKKQKMEKKYKHIDNTFSNFIDFAKKNKEEQLNVMNGDSGIGLFLFCSRIDNLFDKQFPIIDMELDVRGSVEEIDNNHFIIKIGEIKSSLSGISKAKKQLYIRSEIISKAIEVFNSPEEVKIQSQLTIYLPKKCYCAVSNYDEMDFEKYKRRYFFRYN